VHPHQHLVRRGPGHGHLLDEERLARLVNRAAVIVLFGSAISELWAREMRVSGVFRPRNPAQVHLVEGDVTGARHGRRVLPRVTMVA
jgi:hypothetical protein